MDTNIEDIKNIQVKQVLANFLVPILSAVISIGLLGFYVYPASTNIPVIEGELETQLQLAKQLEDKVKKLNSLIDFRTTVEENLNLVSRALSSEPLVPQLLTQIDQIVNQSGLEITKLSYSFTDRSTSADTTNYSLVSVNLGTSGTYDQVITFLSELENSARLVTVQNIRFNTEQDENLISATFVLTSPYVQVDAVASTDDPITFDITDRNFQAIIDQVKALKHYDISIDDVPTDFGNINPEGDVVVDTNEEETPEGEGTENDVVTEQQQPGLSGSSNESQTPPVPPELQGQVVIE